MAAKPLHTFAVLHFHRGSLKESERVGARFETMCAFSWIPFLKNGNNVQYSLNLSHLSEIVHTIISD
jgi:hypothetical protein